MKFITSLLFIVVMLLTSCEQSTKQEINDDPTSPTLFSLMSPEESGFDFMNKVVNQKNFNIFKIEINMLAAFIFCLSGLYPVGLHVWL